MNCDDVYLTCPRCPAGLACTLGFTREWFKCTLCSRRYIIVKEGAFYAEIPIGDIICSRRRELGSAAYGGQEIGHCQQCEHDQMGVSGDQLPAPRAAS